jgi:hypothetical protein
VRKRRFRLCLANTPGYETFQEAVRSAVALPGNIETGDRVGIARGEAMVPGEGFEPPTFGLQNRCTAAVLTRHDPSL